MYNREGRHLGKVALKKLNTKKPFVLWNQSLWGMVNSWVSTWTAVWKILTVLSKISYFPSFQINICSRRLGIDLFLPQTYRFLDFFILWLSVQLQLGLRGNYAAFLNIKLLTWENVHCGLTRSERRIEVKGNRKTIIDPCTFSEWNWMTEHSLDKPHMLIILNTEGLCFRCFFRCFVVYISCHQFWHPDKEHGDQGTFHLFLLVRLLS